MKVKIICAWCSKVIRIEIWPDHDGKKGGEISSHGICEQCLKGVKLEMKNERTMENGKTD
jgi:hypothetical protein